jgi:hypothetical protein
MTAFYKVGYMLEIEERSLIVFSVPNVRKNGANELGLSSLHTAYKEFGTIGNIPIFFPWFCSFCFSILCSFAFTRGYEWPEYPTGSSTVVVCGLLQAADAEDCARYSTPSDRERAGWEDFVPRIKDSLEIDLRS